MKLSIRKDEGGKLTAYVTVELNAGKVLKANEHCIITYDAVMHLTKMNLEYILKKKISKSYTLDDKIKEIIEHTSNYHQAEFAKSLCLTQLNLKLLNDGTIEGISDVAEFDEIEVINDV